MIDAATKEKIERAKERLDLLTEVEKDLGAGKKSGRVVSFHCPFNNHSRGRTPSLVVYDDGGYTCFACNAQGDVVTWLLEYRRLTWQEIFELAGDGDLPPARPRPAAPPPQPADDPPGPTWQARGLAFVDYCERALWADTAGPVYKSAGERLTPLDYLRRARGLSDETIRHYRLGYNPRGLYDDPAAWGYDLAAWTADHQKRKRPDKLWIYAGIVIPWLVGADLWGVNIRPTAGDPKYSKVDGSKAALFGSDELRGADLVLLTEGEFDAMLAAQELGNVAGVATLGSATKHLDVATWGVYLLPARAILAAYDLDKAGRDGLSDLLSKSARIHPARVPALRPGDKDITDYHRAGGDLWEWLKYNLDRLGVLAELGVPVDHGDLAEQPGAGDPSPSLQAALTLGLAHPGGR